MTSFTRPRKVPFDPTLRQVSDAINQLIDLAVQNAGPLTLGVTSLTNANSPYTVTASDQFLGVDTSSGNVTINLPAKATSDGRDLIVLKKTLDNNNITLDGDSTDPINGALTKVIQGQYGGLHIRCDASVGWYIVGFF